MKYETFYDSINEQFRGDKLCLPGDWTELYLSKSGLNWLEKNKIINRNC